MKLGWVDYSKEEKDIIEELLRKLGEEGSLDELGVGIIRDSISDLLYPGTSVLHTRAKYYILIPELFEKAKRSKITSKNEIIKLINDDQDKIAKAFKDKNDNSKDKEEGVIGGRSESVKMKPTRIYWNALRTSKILCDEKLSFEDACSKVAAINRNYQNLELLKENKDNGADDLYSDASGYTIFNVPCREKIEDFLKNPTMKLSFDEANFLYDQFINVDTMKDSLMYYCLKENMSFKDISFFEIPENNISDKLKKIMDLANEFSDFIYGAYIIYNIVFVENGRECDKEEEKEKLKNEYAEWKKKTQLLPDLDDILDLVVGHSTYKYKIRKFLLDLQEAIKENDKNECSEKEKDIIIKRERICKSAKAKLNNKNYKYQRVHESKMNYRHNTAQRIIYDILSGKENV